jgi:hypothetical protein
MTQPEFDELQKLFQRIGLLNQIESNRWMTLMTQALLELVKVKKEKE